MFTQDAGGLIKGRSGADTQGEANSNLPSRLARAPAVELGMSKSELTKSKRGSFDNGRRLEPVQLTGPIHHSGWTPLISRAPANPWCYLSRWSNLVEGTIQLRMMLWFWGLSTRCSGMASLPCQAKLHAVDPSAGILDFLLTHDLCLYLDVLAAGVIGAGYGIPSPV
jgi:hypothetical protein